VSEAGARSARERIAAAIVALVGSEGYKQTTVEMIAQHAGVSRAEFDAEFAGKAECFFSVYEELRLDYLALNAEAFAAGGDWLEGLRRTAYAAFDYFKADEARARFVALEALEAGDRGAAALDSTLEMLVELVHAGRFELADPDSVPRSAAETAVGSIWNMLASQIRSGELGEAEDVVPQLIFFAIMPYKGVEAAEAELARGRPGRENA
jgi:AcrR family transcriptional regulator